MKVNKFIKEVQQGDNEHFDYDFFSVGNMSDPTLMKATIEDLESCYGLDPAEAGEIVARLTH